jgi:hypothetical protein
MTHCDWFRCSEHGGRGYGERRGEQRDDRNRQGAGYGGPPRDDRRGMRIFQQS